MEKQTSMSHKNEETWTPQHSPFCVHIAQCTSNTKFIAKKSMWKTQPVLHTSSMEFKVQGNARILPFVSGRQILLMIHEKAQLFIYHSAELAFEFKRYNKNPTDKTKYSPSLLGIYLNKTCICKPGT